MSASNNESPSIDIIRVISPPHCARGPTRCAKCREAQEQVKICHIRLYLESGLMARPVMKYEIDGETSFFEFDVLQTFANREEAEAYANETGIKDMDFNV